MFSGATVALDEGADTDTEPPSRTVLAKSSSHNSLVLPMVTLVISAFSMFFFPKALVLSDFVVCARPSAVIIR